MNAFSSDVYIPMFEGGDMSVISKGKTAPLYVYRSVVNTKDIIDWAKGQGFKSVIAPSDLHVTVIYSKSPVDWFSFGEDWSGNEKGQLSVGAGGPRAVEKLGDKGAVVLLFASNDLSWRNRNATEDQGASWDFESYQPHITISYSASDMDLSKVEPYAGKIVLGPEMFEDIEENWSGIVVEKIDCQIWKVDDSLGVVFGWGIVCKIDGRDYHDLNIDRNGEYVPENITEDGMLKAAVGFALGDRAGNEMHTGPDIGTFPFVFPLTADIAKAFGIECNKTGLMLGFKPNDRAMLKRFGPDGDLTGFSIEGSRVRVEEIAA